MGRRAPIACLGLALTLAVVICVAAFIRLPETGPRQDPVPPPEPLARAPGLQPEPPILPRVEVDDDANRVVRRAVAGEVLWSTTLDGKIGDSDDPVLVCDAERVYLSHQDGVTALDAATGRELWHARGPNDHLLVSDGLLLATGVFAHATLPDMGHWLLARAGRDGTEVFRVLLPFNSMSPEPLLEVGGRFLVQAWGTSRVRDVGLLVDRGGTVRYRFDRQVVAGKPRGADRLFLTSRDVVCLSADDAVRWSVPFREREWVAGGELVELPDGQMLASLYCIIADSGVQVVRLDPVSGQEVWQAACEPLGVNHSKYGHEATVVVKGGQVHVTSCGDGGTFVEVLDLASGRQVKRTSFRQREHGRNL
jgi:outer membrane protein assembly factor BamB